MTRVDLDRLEAMVQTYAPEGWVRTYVPPLIAELRAAREVVEEARIWSAPANAELMPYAAQRDLGAQVAAYDEVSES